MPRRKHDTPCPFGLSGARDDTATVDPVGFDVAARTVSKKAGPEGVVGIRLFTAHRGHGEVGVPAACRLSVARRGFPGVQPGRSWERPWREYHPDGVNRGILPDAGGEPGIVVEDRGRRLEENGATPGVGAGDPRGAAPRV